MSRPKHPKNSQKWPDKLPNVASETFEKKQFFGCLCGSFPVALKLSTLQLCNVQQLYWWTPLERLKHHLISRPKHPTSDQKKSPTSLLKPYRKKHFFRCLWCSFPVALQPSTLQHCNAQQLYWWTPLETVKLHLISRPKHPKHDQKNSLTSLLKP